MLPVICQEKCQASLLIKKLPNLPTSNKSALSVDSGTAPPFVNAKVTEAGEEGEANKPMLVIASSLPNMGIC